MDQQKIRQQIQCDQKSIDDLCQIARSILKRAKELKDLSEEARELQIKEEFKDFCVEFPSVFSSIVRFQTFYTEPFKKYLEFRSKQKPVYTQEEDSIRDLMRYPLLLWKYQHPHYNQQEYSLYKQQLGEHITEGYRQTKREFKDTYEKFLTIKQTREQERKHNIMLDILRKSQRVAQGADQASSCLKADPK